MRGGNKISKFGGIPNKEIHLIDIIIWGDESHLIGLWRRGVAGGKDDRETIRWRTVITTQGIPSFVDYCRSTWSVIVSTETGKLGAYMGFRQHGNLKRSCAKGYPALIYHLQSSINLSQETIL